MQPLGEDLLQDLAVGCPLTVPFWAAARSPPVLWPLPLLCFNLRNGLPLTLLRGLKQSKGGTGGVRGADASTPPAPWGLRFFLTSRWSPVGDRATEPLVGCLTLFR
ncbi:hypothetical protein Vqi01_42100 [Micromonospora qiuiae]|uniref:Uncharacterized protein n=1 Tax=Micromonospora qiuiae TaxID=502268 RepID=A0ABQ4JFG3_9ACTN|nr:hypothetical protein Vqi01_42100 [Micromonospora qiuiae]